MQRRPIASPSTPMCRAAGEAERILTEWLTAHPIEGTIVVNVGDLLARWTNDRFISTAHRVVNRSGRARYSMGLFVDPDYDTTIEPVRHRGERPRYQPVTCGDYILSRLNAAFAYRK